MKKYWLKRTTGAVLLAMSVASYGLGLGKITVKSYLNQPIEAEIKLIDLNGVPLSGIKVRLADSEQFEKVGLERIHELGKLQFTVTRNKNNQPVIKVSSELRVDEPFLQFLIDLAWAKGQFYRAYTVLLDPPGYGTELQQEIPTKIRANPSVRNNQTVIDRQLDQAMAHDAAWRDKQAINHVIKPPYYSDNLISKEKTNNTHQSSSVKTEQASLPSKSNKSESEGIIIRPAVKENQKPSLFDSLASLPDILSANTQIATKPITKTEDNEGQIIDDKSTSMNEQLKMSLAVIQKLEQANKSLQDNFKAIKEQNQLLNKNLQAQAKELNELHQQFREFQLKTEQLLTRHGIAGQTSTDGDNDNGLGTYLLLAVLLSLTLLGAGIGYFYYQKKREEQHDPLDSGDKTLTLPGDEQSNTQAVRQSEDNYKDEDDSYDSDDFIDDDLIETKNFRVVAEKVDSDNKSNACDVEEEQDSTVEVSSGEKNEDDYTLDFDSGAMDEITANNEKIDEELEQQSEKTENKDDFSLDFEPVSVDELTKEESSEESLDSENEITFEEGSAKNLEQTPGLIDDQFETKLNIGEKVKSLKSPQALDTLLSLADTYIAMEDWISAKQSLDEVLEFGTDKQKQKAQELLATIENKL